MYSDGRTTRLNLEPPIQPYSIDYGTHDDTPPLIKQAANTDVFRFIAVSAIWCVADTLDVVRGGLIMLASKLVG